jgi:hypothetical protein
MDLREVGWDGRDWIDLAQDRDRWRASGFHYMLGNSRVAAQLATSQEGPSSMSE